jgi:hypothetical protein
LLERRREISELRRSVPRRSGGIASFEGQRSNAAPFPRRAGAR